MSTYEVRQVKSDDMGFFSQSLQQHIDRLDEDGFDLVSALPGNNGIVLIGKEREVEQSRKGGSDGTS